MNTITNQQMLENTKGGTFVGFAFGLFLLSTILVAVVTGGLQAFNHVSTHNKLMSANTLIEDSGAETYETPQEIPEGLWQDVGAALSHVNTYELPSSDQEAIYAIAYVEREGSYKAAWQRRIYGGLAGEYHSSDELEPMVPGEHYVLGVAMRYELPRYAYKVCDICTHEFRR